jgi:signal transduction histidine kinase
MAEVMAVPTYPPIERRLLVVDDEKRMLDSLASLLRACGYEVDTASSGREALDKLAQYDYPVVITDLRMDDVDGFELMRSVGEGRHIAFIIITGHASTESAIQAVQHKAFDYLPKPFDFEDLRKAVERAFAAVEAQQFRDDLISMITHDIKVPLSSIVGYATLIFDKTTGELNPRAKDFVQTIHSNALKILSLVDNFLTSCKIEGCKLSLFPRPVNINFLIEDLLSVFQAEAERKQLQIQPELASELPPVTGDENLLFRAISNIISNAFKFTPAGGFIRIRTLFEPAEKSKLGRDCALIEVSNSGPGIPAEDLPVIFEEYRRSAPQSAIEGSGLWLYIARYVVDAHHCSIEVTSTPNELTTFTIRLPIQWISDSEQAHS